jgi:hypothetical protein
MAKKATKSPAKKSTKSPKGKAPEKKQPAKLNMTFLDPLKTAARKSAAKRTGK